MKKVILFIAIIIFGLHSFCQKQKVWLDTDTGNEMDDLYAIVRLLKDTNVNVFGISSAHFNNPDLLLFEKWNGYQAKGLNTLAESQRLNELILTAMNLSHIPHPAGADRQIGRAWGQQNPRPSAAASAIIKAVNELPLEEKLDILTLGALTNIATAVMMDPAIIPRIRCYSLGARYDAKTKTWDKNEFNIRNDLNAFDYLLNLEGFEFIIMPLQAAFPLQFDRNKTFEQLNEAIEIEKILEDRWKEHNPQDSIRIMWDLALIEAWLRPEFSQILSVITPPENKKRKIKVIARINKDALVADFWNVLKTTR